MKADSSGTVLGALRIVTHVWMGLFLYNFHQPKAALPSYGLRCRKLDSAFFAMAFG